MEDVKSFFNTFYVPNNAILTVAGDVSPNKIYNLAKKWFGPIPAGKKYIRQLPKEKKQAGKRTLETIADVPSDALYMAWHMCDRLSPDYHTTDLLSEITGRGKASRLYQRLVRKEKIFHTVNAYIMGSVDPGLFVISGKIKDSYTLDEAEKAVLNIIEEILSGVITEDELATVKTLAETSLAFSEVEIINRAMSLAYFANLGNPNLYELEKKKIKQVTRENLIKVGREILQENNMSVLYYRSKYKHKG
jgi:zinc protease